MLKLALYPVLLLDGELGAGKTTFTRGVVQALPGGDLAEVASPSFNYLNVYPTIPESFHLDFYRLQGRGAADDDLLAPLYEPEHLVIAEWAAYCRPSDLPEDHLAIRFSIVPQGRTALINAKGDKAEQVLGRLKKTLLTNFPLHDVSQGGDPKCGS